MGQADYGALISQGQRAGNAAIDADARTNALMMEKVSGGAGLSNAGGFYAHASADIQDEASVVKENFAAKMREEAIRAQLHSQYMGIMWRNLSYQQRSLRNQEIGAVLGVMGGLGAGVLSSQNQMSPKDMNTEELGNAGLLDPMTGEVNQDALKQYQQSQRQNQRLAGGVNKASGILSKFGSGNQNEFGSGLLGS